MIGSCSGGNEELGRGIRALAFRSAGLVFAEGGKEGLKRCGVWGAVGMIHQDREASQIHLRVASLLACLGQMRQIRAMGDSKHVSLACISSDQRQMEKTKFQLLFTKGALTRGPNHEWSPGLQH